MSSFLEGVQAIKPTQEDIIRYIAELRECVPVINTYFQENEIEPSCFAVAKDGSYRLEVMQEDNSVFSGPYILEIFQGENYVIRITRGGRTSTQTYDSKTGIEIERELVRPDKTKEVMRRDKKYIEKVTHTIYNSDGEIESELDIDISRSRQGIMTSSSEGGLNIATLDAIGGEFFLVKVIVDSMNGSIHHDWREDERDERLINKACKQAGKQEKKCLHYGVEELEPSQGL